MLRHHLLLSTAVLAALFALAGCKSVGEQLGSTVGSTLGTTIGGGLAAQTGTIVGSVVGGEIAELLDPESQRRATEATSEAITTGQPQAWSNPQAGTSGEVQVVAEAQEQKTVEVEVLQEKVEDLPPIDVIGRDYVTTEEANVRGGPGTKYKVVTSLPPGQTVNVVGKVQGKDWYMVSQADVIIGFVSTTLLTPAAPAPTTPPAMKPEGTVVKQAVVAEVTCRTAEHRVRLANGEMKSETIDACQTPDGWESSTRASGGDGKSGTARPT
ncbi:MAG TPA: SH3 domain-containing protein [Kiloniellales bacterium]|nr:SH3 domain-containing protein [Kiloniellales bacterium]